jgi:thiamine-monophosphate kinase
VSELSLIAAIRSRLGEPGGRLIVGPGDDAAVVRAEGVCVTSIDTVVDGVHFELSTHSPGDVGHKALATALSDIAAMGAETGEAYVSVVLPEGFPALEMVDAMLALAERTGCTLAGGDVVSGPVLVVSVAVTGWAASAEHLVLRSGARAGDLVGVTGELGGSGAGLLLLQGAGVQLPEPERAALVRRHRRPEPLLRAGLALASAGVSAMIDVSDGIATDAGHLGKASGAVLELRLADLPLAPGVEAVARACGRDPRELAASAGDDYELLLTAPPERRAEVERAAAASGTRVSWLGDVRAGRGGVLLLEEGGAVADVRGFEHG